MDGDRHSAGAEVVDVRPVPDLTEAQTREALEILDEVDYQHPSPIGHEWASRLFRLRHELGRP